MKITSPEKIVFTNPNITKLEIVQYYQEAAKHMLPYISGRYLALIKCPLGVKGNCFYNKNQDDGLIDVSNINELIYHVQMNTIEFHPWGSTKNNLDKPDIMVFDLDPDEGMDLAQVRQGVKDLKSVLDELSLTSFLKTSGGKGYHIVVPFTPSVDWEAFRNFAKNVAEVMEKKWSSRYTTNVRKNSRAGKIFVDWIRNTKGATSVAPYSIRAKIGAAVSMPIAWSELSKIGPKDIDMKKALKKLKNKNPWAGFEEAKAKQGFNVKTK